MYYVNHFWPQNGLVKPSNSVCAYIEYYVNRPKCKRLHPQQNPDHAPDPRIHVSAYIRVKFSGMKQEARPASDTKQGCRPIL